MNNTNIRAAFFVFTGALFLMWPAFFNGYPFMFSDTGTYISYGFRNLVPLDRPAMYGWFIRHSSLAASMWYTIFTQCLLSSWLLYRFFTTFITRQPHALALYMGSLFILLVGTSLPWYASELMPDVFAGLCVLLLVILLFGTKKHIVEITILSLIFFISCTSATAYVLSMLLMAIIVLLLKLSCRSWFRQLQYRTLIMIGGLAVSCWVGTASINYIMVNSFSINQGSHVFLTGKMVENGILKKYLHESCGTKDYKLCMYKDSLGATATDFVWNYHTSPLYKLGGWEAATPELQRITSDIFSTPRYVYLFIAECIKGTLRQLAFNEAGVTDFAQVDTNSPATWAMHDFVSWEYAEFELAQQFASGVRYNFTDLGRNQNLLVLLSLLVLIFFIQQKNSDRVLNYISVVMLVFIVCNAFTCGGLAIVAPRYSARLLWIVIPQAILLLYINRQIVFYYWRKLNTATQGTQ